MTQQAYPLQWPPGFPRVKLREASRFKATLAGALANVRKSLELFGKESGKAVSGLVISSNYTLGTERPADPGVAVQGDAARRHVRADRQGRALRQRQ